MSYHFEPLVRGIVDPLDPKQLAEDHKCSVKTAKRIINQVKTEEIWINSTYQVAVKKIRATKAMPEMIHLSIKRRDKAPVTDWRDKQEIKNQLVGAECEGIELYPAESRLTDMVNQYHLWVFSSPDHTMPWGWNTRAVETEAKGSAKQRR
jgi:hypothetical protein